MDIRTLICGIIAVTCIISATILYLGGESLGAAGMVGLAGTTAGYVVGLNSEPWAGSDATG